MALPLLFLAGTSVVRAATPAIAKYLAKQGLKRATGAAAKKPVSSTVTSIKQAQRLKPSTKVAGKRPSGSMTQQTTPKSKPLRADPKDRISTPAKKAKTTATGTPTQRKILGAGMTAASLSTLIPKKESGKSQASTQKKTATRTGMGDRKSARSTATSKNKMKTWKDYNTVAAAQAAGSDFFMGKDGKKKLAITKEQLDKSGMSLTGMANKLRKERNTTVKNLVAKAVKSSKGKA